MFRKMQRARQALSPEACVDVLKRELRGVLSVLGDNGYPYGVPLNHWYCEEDGHLYFHSGRTGHKIDAMTACDKASFCVYDAGFRREGEWALNIRSVIVFGRLRLVEDHGRALEISRRLSCKFTSDEQYIQAEIARSGAAVLCFELIPESITGKLVNES